MEQEINRRGRQVSFHELMELALYHPVYGYYSREQPRYGRHGDYLTAPTASHWYAAVLARLLGRLANRTGHALTVVDLAAGDGSLLGHLAAQLTAHWPGTVQQLVSVERSAAMRRRQEDMRRRQEEQSPDGPLPLTIRAELAACDPAQPVVLHASELYDALPVHRVVQRQAGLQELWVAVDQDRLVWREQPAPAPLQQYLAGHGVTLEHGQVAEINLGAGPLHRQLLQQVTGDGITIVLDYGYEASRLYNARGRSGGSLACYHQHRLSRDPLARPGEQDITAHICWDDLRAAAATAGWQEVALLPLAELLVRAGLEAEVERHGLGMEAELDAETVSQRQEIKRLLDPEGMGSDLRVLLQATPSLVSELGSLLGLSPEDR